VPVDLAIYLNRPIRWTPSPDQFLPSSRPQVLIKLQNHGEAAPAPPPGWDVLATVPRDNDFYWAFARQVPRD
jgi:hypothetical protein